MALQLTPLDPAALPPAVAKAIAGGPQRLLASRGMVPFSRPSEFATTLYMLALDAEAPIAAGAAQTAQSLPDKILAGMVAEVDLDPRVLHWLAGFARSKPAVVEVLLGNPLCADQTVAEIARDCSMELVERIAVNEQRLLRCPDIIAAMYMNKRARMSTVERAVELAVRNQIRVEGLPAWDEISRALIGDAATSKARGEIVEAEQHDELFAKVAQEINALDDSALTQGDAEDFVPRGMGEIEEVAEQATPEEIEDQRIPINKMTIPMKIRLASLGNAFARAMLVRDPIKMVAMAAIKSPAVTDIEAAKYAANANLVEDVIRYIANKREWTRLYGIKMSLVCNPKTPTGDALRFLQHLRDNDVRNVSKSRGVPSPIQAAARRIIAVKAMGGNKKK